MKLYEGIIKSSRNKNNYTIDVNGCVIYDYLKDFIGMYEIQPYVIKFNHAHYTHYRFIDMLRRSYKNMQIAYEESTVGSDEHHTMYLLLDNGLTIMFNRITNIIINDSFDVINSKGKPIKGNPKLSVAQQISILFAPETEKESIKVVDLLQKMMVTFTNKPDPVGPLVGFIVEGQGVFSIQEFIFDDIKQSGDLDLHYGSGTEILHTELLYKLHNRDNGLVLLHGETGTGKTYYIRKLIYDIHQTGINKPILYMSPKFLDNVQEPTFMGFLSRWSMQNQNGAIVIIEDVDAMIFSAYNNIKTSALSTLLSCTDGILNDVFKFQMVISFTGKLEEINESLLRPQRMIARRSFNSLDINSAKKLSSSLGVDSEAIKTPLTVAEVYSLLPSERVIEFRDDNTANSIGFGQQ